MIESKDDIVTIKLNESENQIVSICKNESITTILYHYNLLRHHVRLYQAYRIESPYEICIITKKWSINRYCIKLTERITNLHCTTI